MGLGQVRDFYQNQLFNQNKRVSCLIDRLDFVVKVSAFGRNIFIKKSNFEIHSENLEILYLGYAYSKILVIFKFTLKIILIILYLLQVKHWLVSTLISVCDSDLVSDLRQVCHPFSAPGWAQSGWGAVRQKGNWGH